jgi:hypothetical protein
MDSSQEQQISNIQNLEKRTVVFNLEDISVCVNTLFTSNLIYIYIHTHTLKNFLSLDTARKWITIEARIEKVQNIERKKVTELNNPSDE